MKRYSPSTIINLSETHNKRAKHIILEWNHLEVSTSKGKWILKEVSGRADPGMVLAVIGLSGSGKSALLEVLSGWSSLDSRGTILVNGRKTKPKVLKQLSALVGENEPFLDMLTAREHLIYKASFHMEEDPSEIVDELLEDLHLSADAVIKLMSHGEHKRLALVSALIADRPILMCEEPDISLHDIALSGKTVICSLRRPETWATFQRVLLLSAGRTAFFGSPQDAMKFFTHLGKECPPFHGPADYFMQEASGEESKEICDAFACSEFAFKAVIIDETEFEFKPSYISWIRRFLTLVERCYLSGSRDHRLTTYRMLQALSLGTLLGIVFWHRERNQLGVDNINSLLFLLVVGATVLGGLDLYATKLPVLRRERGLYGLGAYFLAKTLTEALLFAPGPIMFATITYWLGHLRPDTFVYLRSVLVLLMVTHTTLSFTSCVTTSFASAFIFLLALYGNYLVEVNTIPWIISWIRYLSWFEFAYESLIIGEWKGSGGIACNTAPPCLFKNGTDVLDYLNIQTSRINFNYTMLVVLLVVYWLLSFVSFSENI